MSTEKKTEVIQTRVTKKTKKRAETLAKERGMASSVDWVRYLIDREIEIQDNQQKR